MNKKLLFLIFVSCQISLVNITFAETSDSAAVKDSIVFHKLNIISNFMSAKIFIDTGFIGTTPLYNFEIAAGFHNIKVFNSKGHDWNSENKFFEVYIDRDTTLTADFKFFYFFSTNPFDANVFKRDSLIGSTPLRFFSDHELTGNLIFKKQNYKDYIFDLKNYDFETGTNIILQPKGIVTVNDLVYKNRTTQFKTKRSLIPILGLGAASIAGGYFAINFKNKANDAYNIYLQEGNSVFLDDSETNDTYFVISLVLMQAAVGGLIYFLFFD